MTILGIDFFVMPRDLMVVLELELELVLVWVLVLRMRWASVEIRKRENSRIIFITVVYLHNFTTALPSTRRKVSLVGRDNHLSLILILGIDCHSYSPGTLSLLGKVIERCLGPHRIWCVGSIPSHTRNTTKASTERSHWMNKSK